MRCCPLEVRLCGRRLVVCHGVQTGLAMNDNEQLTPEQRSKLERLRQHQARFKERRFYVGFCRWMALRYGGSTARPEGRGGHISAPMWCTMWRMRG
jgi:hypothetical protein